MLTRFRDIHFWFDEVSFKESEHPRDPEGKFSTSGGKSGATSHLLPSAGTGKERTTLAGLKLPVHILSLKVPPAWTDMKYSPDPDAPLLAVGKDVKGRPQYIYSAKFAAEQAALKFARIRELDQQFDKVLDENAKARQSKDPKVREAADCAALVMAVGIRPGSDDDTKAAVKAYGATTLEGKHVVVLQSGVRLRFTGKKGVSIDIPVQDESLVKMLVDRKNRVGNTGRLFNVSNNELLNHVHTYGDGGFKTKDMRTLLGTRTAIDEVSKMHKPKDEKEYKKAVMAVAKVVASCLGNTPVVALQSYISPTVFAPWRMNDAITT